MAEEDHNKEIVSRFWEELFNGGDLKVADEIIASECSLKDPAFARYRGPQDVKELVENIRKAYPAIQATVKEFFSAEDGRVVTSWSGTPAKASADSDAPDVSLLEGIAVFLVEDSKIQSIQAVTFAPPEDIDGVIRWWCQVVRC